MLSEVAEERQAAEVCAVNAKRIGEGFIVRFERVSVVRKREVL